MLRNLRSTFNADGIWKFCVDTENIGIKSMWYQTGLLKFREVRVPHTFNVEDQYQEYRGVSWYQYQFIADEKWCNKRIRMKFGGIYRDADIWMNGIKIAEHFHSGFTSFTIDTMDSVKCNEVNTLIIRVDNSYSDTSIPINNSFDWADDGGIFRKVTFIISDKIAIDYAKIDPKVIIKDYRNRSTNADTSITARVYLCNSDSNSNQLSYDIAVYEDEDLTNIIYQSEQYMIENRVAYFDIIPIHLRNINLWHFDAPNLYYAIISIHKDGAVCDELVLTMGFREFITKDSEFYLNGEKVRLVGTEWMPGSHPAYGNAEPDEYLEKILIQLKNSNCVFTRFHWQQDDFIYDWCNKNGMLVQEEIPNWGGLDQKECHLEVSKQQANEMIISHYNHPCIVSWGIGNELKGQEKETIDFLIKVRDYFKNLDPNRMINYISNTMWDNPKEDASTYGDSLWINDYIGSWHGNLDNELELKKVVLANPNKPLVMSEFGLCEPAFLGGDRRRIEVFKEKMDLYRKFPQIAGIINFCLNDYRTQFGEEGRGVLRRRVHGSTDIFGEAKPSYYVVQTECSPIEVEFLTDELRIRVKSDLPSYKIMGYKVIIINEREMDGIAYEIPTLDLGESYSIKLESRPYKVQVFRPTGFITNELYLNM